MKTLRLGLMFSCLVLCLEESFTFPVALPQDLQGKPKPQRKLFINEEVRYDPTSSPRLEFWKWLGWKHRDEVKYLEVDSSHQTDTFVDPCSDNLNAPEDTPHVLEPDTTTGAVTEEDIVQSTIKVDHDIYSRQGTHSHFPDTANEAVGGEKMVSYEPKDVSDNEPRQYGVHTNTNGEAEDKVNHDFENARDNFGATTNSDDEVKVNYGLDENHGDFSEAELTSITGAGDTEDENTDDIKHINDDRHDSHIIFELDDGTLITDEYLSYLESFYNEYDLAISGEQGSSEASKKWSESDKIDCPATFLPEDETKLVGPDFTDDKSESLESVLSEHESRSLETELSDDDSFETLLPGESSHESGDETKILDGKFESTGSDEPKPDKPEGFGSNNESSSVRKDTGQRRTGCRLKHDEFDLSDLSEVDDFARDESDKSHNIESIVKAIIIMFWKFVLKTILRCLGL